MTTLSLVTVLGLYWLIAGAIDVVMAVLNKTGEKSRGWELAGGILGIIAGLIILNNPVVATVFSVAFLVYFIAFAFLFSGAVHIFLGSNKDSSGKYKWTWGSLALGILYVILGLMLLGGPMIADAASMIWAFGFLGIVGGIMAIVGAFAMKDK